MSTPAAIIAKQKSGYAGIYLHFDGGPNKCLKILRDHYTDPAKVNELISLGNLSSLGPNIGTQHDFDLCPDGECNFYGRDYGEDDTNAVSGNDVNDVARKIDADYCYIFNNGTWTQLKDYTEESKKLADDVLAQHRVESVPSNPEFQLRPMTPNDYSGFSGVEEPDGQEALIGETEIDGKDAVVLVGKDSVHVLLYGPNNEWESEYVNNTPFNQGKAIAQQVGRVTTIQELVDLRFAQIN